MKEETSKVWWQSKTIWSGGILVLWVLGSKLAGLPFDFESAIGLLGLEGIFLRIAATKLTK